MNMIQVEINPQENLISVWNNGSGIPIQMHQDHGVYVPEMIFGQLLTSSNYNQREAAKRVAINTPVQGGAAASGSRFGAASAQDVVAQLEGTRLDDPPAAADDGQGGAPLACRTTEGSDSSARPLPSSRMLDGLTSPCSIVWA